MELHAPDRQSLMAHAHDLAFLGLGCDLEAIRQRVPLDDERMVACRGKGIWHAFEKILTIVLNHRSFAMHHAVIDDDICSKGVTDALMAQANTENRNFLAELSDDVVGETGFVGRTGPGRHEDPLRVQRFSLVQSDLVIPAYFHLSVQLPEILNEVIREGIVVIDHQDHTGDTMLARNGRATSLRLSAGLVNCYFRDRWKIEVR